MTAKANPHRGEISLGLGDKTYRLVPSYENLAKLEEVNGISILDFAQKIHNRTIKIQDLAGVLAVLAEPEINKDQAARALIKEGLVKTIGPISKFFANALLGGQEGNPDPAKEA